MTDTELLNHFFWAWGMRDAGQRRSVLSECFAEDGLYSDPHCTGPVTGLPAVAAMLSDYAANMPGGAARVAGEAEGHNGFMRAEVVFEKDGAEVMRGRYFARREGNALSLVVGFVGAAT